MTVRTLTSRALDEKAHALDEKAHALDETPVTLDGHRVTLSNLVIDDPSLAELLRSHDESSWTDLVTRALTTGARGLLTMGLGADVAAVERRVRATLETVTSEAEARVTDLLREGADAFASGFDPEQRSSHIARALAEFASWRDEFLGSIDPNQAGSHTTQLLRHLEAMLGPQGALEQRLEAALDPDADGSGLARLEASLARQLTDIRDLIVEGRGREEGREAESERGTAHGFDFEDVIEERLRASAAAIGGCFVDRVGRVAGSLGPKSTVGDFVVELADGRRIVIEAKRQSTLTVGGRDGVLAELDRAMANRDADAAICVSGKDAFPSEVNRFAVFGNRVLVVDDGEGTLLDIALRWIMATLGTQGRGAGDGVDQAAIGDRLQRITALAERFKTGQRALTDVGKSVDTVRQGLSDMRADLLELVDDLARELQVVR